MKFENTEVFNFEGALRGMRNPLNSHAKSDSRFIKTTDEDGFIETINIGENDMKLALSLIKAGGEHRKFMRQIFVSVDITAPIYWWKEFDTYKVGTVANSTSTMHKLASTPITKGCFEMDDFENLEEGSLSISYFWESAISRLEFLRQKYNETKDKRYWKELIRLLPESWLQTRTVTMNYENLLNMFHQRKNHKLTEWHSFCDWVKTLPCAKEFICE
ncbi:MAG: hypothetical protein J6S85_19530 [Methanobrevibacter sp.]|nr:hypothetical protein [Methanobrevibacter sp.]